MDVADDDDDEAHTFFADEISFYAYDFAAADAIFVSFVFPLGQNSYVRKNRQKSKADTSTPMVHNLLGCFGAAEQRERIRFSASAMASSIFQFHFRRFRSKTKSAFEFDDNYFASSRFEFSIYDFEIDTSEFLFPCFRLPFLSSATHLRRTKRKKRKKKLKSF